MIQKYRLITATNIINWETFRRTELSEAKKQLKENEVVIEGLTRDLAGANARLNDVAG